MLFIIAAIIILILLITIKGGITLESPQKAAGKRGERQALEIIKSILRDDDQLFTNVTVSYDGKEAELDNVVVNKNGVFIIEVKNYSGKLEGAEDDFEWTKTHISRGGNTYVKTVKNPIKQVRRQIYILAKYLEYYGTQVWVEGYVIILDSESPVESPVVLTSASEIDQALHCAGKQRLDKSTIDRITDLLSY